MKKVQSSLRPNEAGPQAPGRQAVPGVSWACPRTNDTQRRLYRAIEATSQAAAPHFHTHLPTQVGVELGLVIDDVQHAGSVTKLDVQVREANRHTFSQALRTSVTA